jgi:hypothetical protein
MTRLIGVAGSIINIDQVVTVTYDGQGAATIVYRTGQTQKWSNGEIVRRALAPWLARPGDQDTVALLRRHLTEAKAQALRADDKIGTFERARMTAQLQYRQQAAAWVRSLLGED